MVSIIHKTSKNLKPRIIQHDFTLILNINFPHFLYILCFTFNDGYKTDTMPDGPRERTIVYQAPFDRCDREQDYEIVWAEFEKRFGTTKHTNNAKVKSDK